jgi:two-component system chemotaxis sensor kinase CheA
MWLVIATQADNDAIEQALEDIAELSQSRVQPYTMESSAAAPPSSSQLPAYAPGQGNDNTVRINVEHLDTLMNLVGELVTDRTRLEQIESTLRVRYGRDESVTALNEMSTHFTRVVDQLQQEVMQARMLPIARLFTKFPRLVRDVARAAGKQVNLIIEGESTELDRSVIEVIGDPLIHLLRNAVDHGIEQQDEREAAGKPATGTVWLTAGHEEGHIVVTVRDDGRGIDPAKIRKAAVSRGLMSKEEVAQMDEDSAISLIFQPNLSTAEQVTDVSGRGVGLDVVRANIKRLSGSVVVESELGVGTTFRLTLPLTLAILQTMLVSLGDDVYAIPLTGIVETLYLSDVKVGGVKGKPVIRWRDSVLPLMHLRRFFARPGQEVAPPGENGGAVVTVAWGKQQVGLIVDKLIGKREIVIKSLSPIFGNVPGLSGCAILGDGRVGLIVDIPGLINATVQLQR